MKRNKQNTIVEPQLKPKESTLPKSFKWHGWFVFLVGSVLYFNTISHQFTQDDAIVIYDNMYTTKGVSGLKGLFTNDSFFGFFKEEGKAKLVSGGRYRPLTPAMFAIEYALVGKNPWLGHCINILLYGFLCYMIYQLLLSLLCYKEDHVQNRYLVLAIALLYAAHPIHTEVVANIKGRDEIMSMLGSILALFFVLKYVDLRKGAYLAYACIAYFLALLSKENTITFLAVIPLALFYFRNIALKGALLNSTILLIPTIMFLMIRAAILGNDFGGTPMELMNNPYLKLVNDTYIPLDFSEKIATIIYTLGKYIQLLLFPHPLTHDYYPRYIDIKNIGDVWVLMSTALHLLLIWLAIKGIKNKSIIGFGISYYIITLSIVSNVVFPIGTNMSERFMFMPSLGFAMVLGVLLHQYIYKKLGQSAFFIAVIVILSLYGLKTFTRNFVWESDFKLFTTDVKTSVNSAKVLNAAGGALTTEASKEKDEVKKSEMLRQALTYLEQAVKIHPHYKNAYLIAGNAHYFLKEYEKSIKAYEQALKLDPDFKDAYNNLAVAYRDAGRVAGEIENNLQKSESYLTRSYQLVPKDATTLRLLGVVNGVQGKYKEALPFFEKVVLLEPNASGYLDLSNTYRNLGDNAKAEEQLQKALSLDPNILNKSPK